MPTTTATSTAAGDQSYNLTSNSDTYLTSNLNLVANTTTIAPCITLGGYNSINNWNIASPKNGDIEIDGISLKAKIYDGEKNKWVNCDIETIKNKDGETKLEVTYELSVQEEKEKRNERHVLFEKFKPIQNIIFSGTTTLGTIFNNFYVQPQPQYDFLDIDGSLYVGNNNIVYGGTLTTVPYGNATGTLVLTGSTSLNNMWHDGTSIVLSTSVGPVTLTT